LRWGCFTFFAGQVRIAPTPFDLIGHAPELNGHIGRVSVYHGFHA
jgi:hypothetical protein